MVWYQHNRKFRNIYICTRYFKGNKHSLYCRTSIYGSGICMLYMSHHLQWSLPETYVCSKLVVRQKLVFALLVCGGSGASRGYHSPRSQCFRTDMVYEMAYNVIIIKAIIMRQMYPWSIFAFSILFRIYGFLAPTNSFGFLISWLIAFLLNVVSIKTQSEHLLKYRSSYLPMWYMHFVKLWKIILNSDSRQFHKYQIMLPETWGISDYARRLKCMTFIISTCPKYVICCKIYKKFLS